MRLKHMWLVGCPSPNKMEQSWECIFWNVFTIDVRKGVLGGLTPSLRLKIWADPPSWKIFEQVTP